MNKKGFTLVEIIVTVCMIAILMSLAVPGLMNYLDDVETDRCIAETKSIVAQITASNSQRSLSGTYGTTLSGNELNQFMVDVVKKAKGNGEIEFITFDVNDSSKLDKVSYIINGYAVFYDAKDDSYFIGEYEK